MNAYRLMRLEQQVYRYDRAQVGNGSSSPGEGERRGIHVLGCIVWVVWCSAPRAGFP